MLELEIFIDCDLKAGFGIFEVAVAGLSFVGGEAIFLGWPI